MKCVYALLLAVGLMACRGPKTEAEKDKERLQRLEESRVRIEQLQLQASACDKNDGIKDISPAYCSRGRCSGTIVMCNDGMERRFESIR